MGIHSHPTQDAQSTVKRSEELRCFKCNRVGHKSCECSESAKGRSSLECYNCRQSGHMARDCKVKRPPQKDVKYAAVAIPINPMDMKDGKLVLKSGETVDIVSASYSQVICHSNLPTAYGSIGDKRVEVLRDTGCSGVLVKKDFVESNQYTG